LPLRDLLLAALVPLLWGLGFALAKPAVGHFPPLFMLCFCYASMGLLMGWRLRRGLTPWYQILLIAALIGPLQGGLLFHGLRGLPASVAVLLVQLQVPFALLVAWPLLGERPRAAGLLGTAIAFTGIVLILGMPEEAPDARSAALVLCGAVFWATGQVLVRRWNRDSGPAMSTRVALFSLPLGLAGSLAIETGQLEAVASASWQHWAALGAMVLLGYVLSYLIWYGLLQRQRMDRLMPFILLMPPVTVSIGVVALGEPFAWTTLAGGLVVLAGLALVVLRRPPVAAAAE